ncbi:Uncharacterised protein [Mycobacterium tuberculosis]|nr:Uncharacterised protein [Mycobacterium tuberculosis]
MCFGSGAVHRSKRNNAAWTLVTIRVALVHAVTPVTQCHR